ncbi:MAG TPA: sodium:proton antiporter, partial [Chromatiaceae bacterium]|nr:sodium:proton antiporter [Chromatiaceae bacterium]
MTTHAPMRLILPAAALLAPGLATAAESANHLDLTNHWVGYLSILLFVIAYLFVMAEEFTHLRKSKPVILAAGIIWALIAYVYVQHGLPAEAEQAV